MHFPTVFKIANSSVATHEIASISILPRIVIDCIAVSTCCPLLFNIGISDVSKPVSFNSLMLNDICLWACLETLDCFLKIGVTKIVVGKLDTLIKIQKKFVDITDFQKNSILITKYILGGKMFSKFHFNKNLLEIKAPMILFWPILTIKSSRRRSESYYSREHVVQTKYVYI